MQHTSNLYSVFTNGINAATLDHLFTKATISVRDNSIVYDDDIAIDKCVDEDYDVYAY